MARPETTRQILIEKTAVMINEKGVSGTAVDDVLKAAKVAKGSLYGHFPGKAELSHATVDYMLARVVEKRKAAIDKGITAKEKIYAFMHLVRNPINSMIDGGCPVINLSVESDDTDPIIRKKVRVMIENTFKMFTSILQEGIASGELSPRLNPEEFSQRMFVSISGANAICRVLGTLKPMQLIAKGFCDELESYSTDVNKTKKAHKTIKAFK